MKIARIFPRKTKASPNDDLAFFDVPGLFPPKVNEVHISVAFTYDIEKAKWLAKQWNHVAPVKIGGPAFNNPSGEFEPGKYLKPGYTITSRGCPNKCWFCSVWKREPKLKELEIKEGWNVLDDNLLACSEKHIRAVFAMLKQQKKKAEFTGGIEAARLRDWHINLFIGLKPTQIFFAYDTDDDLEPLMVAARKMVQAGFNRNQLRCYVLIGYPNDTVENATKRLKAVLKLGMFPAAMLYKDKNGKQSIAWKQFQRLWIRPAAIYAMEKKLNRYA